MKNSGTWIVVGVVGLGAVYFLFLRKPAVAGIAVPPGSAPAVTQPTNVQTAPGQVANIGAQTAVAATGLFAQFGLSQLANALNGSSGTEDYGNGDASSV